MSDIEFNIQMHDAIQMFVENIENGIELVTKQEEWAEVGQGNLELTLLANVASSDSLYRMAVRMGYEGTEEDFVNFLMSESKDGFINVDNRYPRDDGQYYTLETAIRVVANDTTLTPEQKNGMIFTFYNGSGCDVFQFNKPYTGSESASDFSDKTNWESLKAPIADEDTAGRVKLTDTIDVNNPQDVSDDTAVTAKAVVDYLNANPSGLERVASYMDLPAIGNPRVVYYIEDSEIFYIYTNGLWKLMTPTWNNIKIIQGDTSIRV